MAVFLENATADIEEGMTAALELLQRKRHLRSELWRAFLKKPTHVGISVLLLRMAAADLCESDEHTVCNVSKFVEIQPVCFNDCNTSQAWAFI